MPKIPDHVIYFPEGGAETFTFRAHPNTRGDLVWTRRVFDRNGNQIEVWHESADRTGRIVHSQRLL